MIENAAVKTLVVEDELRMNGLNDLAEEQRQVQCKSVSLEQNLQRMTVSIIRGGKAGLQSQKKKKSPLETRSLKVYMP